MVLTQADIQAEFPGLPLDPEDSGYHDNEAAADDSIDPDDTASNLAVRGRLDGYALEFSDPLLLFDGTISAGVFNIGSSVALFDSPQSAQASIRREIEVLSRLQGNEIEEGVILKEFQESVAPDVGMDTVAGRLTVSLDLPGFKRDVASTFVRWRRGPVVAAVGAVALDDKDLSAAIERLAQRMEERIDDVLSGESVVKPSDPASVSSAECQFEVPAGETVECGYLTVPEDRERPGGPSIRLHYALFRSHSDDPAPDPVVYLEGGPGGKALELVPLTFSRLFTPFLEDRNFIMFDQRGTGFSEPTLDCPEYVKMVYDTLDQDPSVAESVALVDEAVHACHDRLSSEEANLAAYTTAENAADLNDLRLALGYEEWNLYGVSYGTRLALTTMRDFPEGIRSVILDSSYPLQTNVHIAISSNADRSFNVLFDGCASDASRTRLGPSCGEAYPELEATFFDLVEQLNDSPVTFSITNPLTYARFDALLSGHGLVDFLFQSLYSAEIIPFLPKIIFDARDGDFDLLALIQGSFLADIEFISWGMFYSVRCGEEVHFSTREEVAAAAEAYPHLGEAFDISWIFTVCQSWGARGADPIQNAPVASDIPTLVLAGEYDPITPPAWGQMAAEGLSNGFFFEFPGVGHGASFSTECALDMALNFLDDPTTEPNGGCIATMTGPAFVAP